MTRAILTLTTLAILSPAAALPVSLTANGLTLHGTLELPTTAAPHPVALIIAGSGPTDRDGNSAALPGRNDSLKLLAQHLARHGVATVRYDKRGIGQSKTTQAEHDVTFDDFVNDAAAWIRHLRADRRFSSVSVIGHSEGSLVGMLAAQHTHVTAFVSLAGPGENLADTILRQVRANPANPTAIVKEVEASVAELRAGRTVQRVNPLLAPLLRPSVQPFLISAFKHDPGRALGQVKAPVLIAQGDQDLQVTTRDAQNLKAAHPASELLILKGVNHVLKRVGTDLVLNQRSYVDPTVPFAAELPARVATFIKDAADKEAGKR